MDGQSYSGNSQDLIWLDFEDDQRHQSLSKTKLTRLEVFLLVLARPYFLTSQEVHASSPKVFQQPLWMQHYLLGTHDVLGTLTPPSSHCKEAISCLASIHSPSHAFQRVLLSPVKVLIPTVSLVSRPLCVMDWPHRAPPKHSELFPFVMALLSVDDELPSHF